MRATRHSGKVGRSGKTYGGKHNDRDFDLEQADNIDASRTPDNVYKTLNAAVPVDPALSQKELESRRPGKAQGGRTFDAYEHDFYAHYFGKRIEETNAKYIEQRHPERCKTVDEWRAMKRYAPEETLLQFGSYDDGCPDREVFKACIKDYLTREIAYLHELGNPATILSVAEHFDEAVNHAHERKVWMYKDDDGKIQIGQEKSLERAGVPLPHPDKPPGQYNNRKMTYDKHMREIWLEVGKEHGLDLETEPLPDRKHNRELDDVIREKHAERIRETRELDKEIEHKKELLEITENTLDTVENTLDSLREQRDFEEKKLENVRGMVESQQDIADRLREDVSDASEELERVKGSVKFLNDRKTTMETAIDGLDGQIEEKNNVLIQLAENVQTAERMAKERKAQIDREVEEAEHELYRTELLTEQAGHELDEVKEQVTAYRKELDVPIERAVEAKMRDFGLDEAEKRVNEKLGIVPLHELEKAREKRDKTLEKVMPYLPEEEQKALQQLFGEKAKENLMNVNDKYIRRLREKTFGEDMAGIRENMATSPKEVAIREFCKAAGKLNRLKEAPHTAEDVRKSLKLTRDLKPEAELPVRQKAHHR